MTNARADNDEKILRFFHHHLHPLLMFLYTQSKLEAPLDFDWKLEGPRLVVALREQGFATQFNEGPKQQANGHLNHNSRERL